MARHQEQGFDGRRRQNRTGDEGRGPYGREEQDRRSMMDKQRWEDEPWASRERGRWENEPWASRERGRWGDSEREWPRQYSEGGARHMGERAQWPESSRGAYEQGGYWQSEAAHRGQGGYGPGSYYDQSRQFGQEEYGERRQFGQGEYGQGWDRERAGMGRWGSGPGIPEHGPYAGRGPKGYQRSDERIREDVCERLTQHGHIDASEIEVKVSNREITLTGMVPSRQAKRMAEDIAEGVSGVTDVNNQLRVSHEAADQQGPMHGTAKSGREGQHSTRAA